MALLLLLRVVALLLLGHLRFALPLPAPRDPSSSSHTLKYFYTAVSENNELLSSFIIVGYMDDQRICQYDSIVRSKRPCVSWMKKVVEEDPSYWEDETEVSRNSELFFKESLVTAKNRYNQSGGFHTLQQMYGCELRKDGRKGGYRQYAYDGMDFISFDKETLTWTAADVPAQNTKRKWDAQSTRNQYLKAYLEGECIEWLKKYLEYGKETLLRTETPEVMVTRKADLDGMETLICRVGGFYPRDIDIDWTRDGEVWLQDTFRGLVSPNSDGTYYTWKSITVDPNERKRYKCHVEHDGLQTPVDVAWEEPASKLGLIIGCTLGFLLLLAALAGIAVYVKKHPQDYKAVLGSVQQYTSSEKESDHKSNISKEGSDKKSKISKEASERGSHNSEEPLRPSDSSDSIEAVPLCPSDSSDSIEAALRPSDTSDSIEAV